jgi:hypothetical protein
MADPGLHHIHIDSLVDGMRHLEDVLGTELEPIRDTGAVRCDIKITYRHRPVVTVPVEIAEVEASMGSEVDHVPTRPLSDLGIDTPGSVPCIAVRWQIAQKKHRRQHQRASRWRRWVAGIRRRGTSRAGAQGESALPDRRSGILQRSTDVIDNELRIAGDNVGRGRPLGDERRNRRNRETCAIDARHATDHAVVHADSLESHLPNLRHAIEPEPRPRPTTPILQSVLANQYRHQVRPTIDAALVLDDVLNPPDN